MVAVMPMVMAGAVDKYGIAGAQADDGESEDKGSQHSFHGISSS
jgi:hypothetical protein